MSRRVSVDPGVAQGLLAVTGYIYAAFAILVGLGTIVGGATRWRAAAYRTALQVPGAPESWGAALLIAGVLLLVGTIFATRSLIVTGALSCALWCLFFGVSIAIETWSNPAVGFTGPLVWMTFGALYTVRFVSMWRRFA